MVWNAGIGPWWAATAVKVLQVSGQRLWAQTALTNNARWTIQHNSANQFYAVRAVDFRRFFQTRDVDKYLSDWTLFIYLRAPNKTTATPNGLVVVDL